MTEEIADNYLCAKEISKEYTIGKSTIRVLDKVDLDVKKGEILIDLGASGAGKS